MKKILIALPLLALAFSAPAFADEADDIAILQAQSDAHFAAERTESRRAAYTGFGTLFEVGAGTLRLVSDGIPSGESNLTVLRVSVGGLNQIGDHLYHYSVGLIHSLNPSNDKFEYDELNLGHEVHVADKVALNLRVGVSQLTDPTPYGRLSRTSGVASAGVAYKPIPHLAIRADAGVVNFGKTLGVSVNYLF